MKFIALSFLLLVPAAHAASPALYPMTCTFSTENGNWTAEEIEFNTFLFLRPREKTEMRSILTDVRPQARNHFVCSQFEGTSDPLKVITTISHWTADYFDQPINCSHVTGRGVQFEGSVVQTLTEGDSLNSGFFNDPRPKKGARLLLVQFLTAQEKADYDAIADEEYGPSAFMAAFCQKFHP